MTEINGPVDRRDFLLTRIIGATRARLFDAWTDPRQLAQWWGPRGFTCPVCTVDLRPGGAYRIVMRSADGADYPLKGVYREIVRPEKLVFTDNWEEHPDDFYESLRNSGAVMSVFEALNTVTFEEYKGKTKLTIRTRFESPAVRDAFVNMGMTDGWTQSLEKLEELMPAV
jgi:uncharacterized protein YndB with AHSA1/START domain